MLQKLLGWLKGTGAQTAVNLLPLAEPYLVEQIQKAHGLVGSTPQEQAHFFISHIQNYLKSKLGLK